MTKEEAELKRIDNALKKDEKVAELKEKHDITGTKEQQREKVDEKLEEISSDNKNENELDK